MDDTSKDFASWYGGLGEPERDSFARRANTTRGYIETHLLGAQKIPRAESMEALAKATETFTVAELAAWFYEASLTRKAHRNSQGAQ